MAVHSGSRNLGLQVENYHQKIAQNMHPECEKWLAYLEGEELKDYLNDMKIAQFYAETNRIAILHDIINEFDIDVIEKFTTVHNYIDMETMILRKGAVSAKRNEKIIIPLNMRDGSIIAVGRGNPDWNYSAPHGAGRIMSRRQARENVDLEEFKESMKDVYTTSVCKNTLDESPFAYKDMNEIIGNVKETIKIIDIIKPIYNFKASN